MQILNSSKMKSFVFMAGTTLAAGFCIGAENSMYQCLDEIELAERFEAHSHEATYLMDKFQRTTFQGKEMTWVEIEQELQAAGYKDVADAANYTDEENILLRLKREKALKDPRIKELAEKYETEFRADEQREKRARNRDELLSKTYSFHKSRGGSKPLEGIDNFDLRKDRFSPIRPYGLVATRAKSDGQYLYVLTRDGSRRVRVSDKPETVGNRHFLAFRRLKDAKPIFEDGFPRVDVVQLKGSDVTSNWPSAKEVKDAKIESMEILLDPTKSAAKFGKKLIVVDFETTPSDQESSADANEVFKEELSKIIGKVVDSHDSQMAYLKKLDGAQKDRIKQDWKFDEARLSEVYTERYMKALQKCADLNIGVESAAITAIDKIKGNQQKHFRIEKSDGAPKEAPASGKS